MLEKVPERIEPSVSANFAHTGKEYGNLQGILVSSKPGILK
jgi:hypothetical protein